LNLIFALTATNTETSSLPIFSYNSAMQKFVRVKTKFRCFFADDEERNGFVQER